MLIRDWLRHPTIDARAWVVHLLLTVMSVEDAFAFHAWVPVKFSVGVKHEFAKVFFSLSRQSNYEHRSIW